MGVGCEGGGGGWVFFLDGLIYSSALRGVMVIYLAEHGGGLTRAIKQVRQT